MSRNLVVLLLVGLVLAGCGNGRHARKEWTRAEGQGLEGAPSPREEDDEATGDGVAPARARSQFRGFLLPLLLEYDLRLAGPSWLGLELSLGPTMQLREPGTIGGGAGAMVLYRWQTPVRRLLGFSAAAGAGLGLHSLFDGDRPPFGGLQLQAGAEVRYAFLSAGVNVLYLTPFHLPGYNGGFVFANANQTRFVLVPRIALVFAF